MKAFSFSKMKNSFQHLSPIANLDQAKVCARFKKKQSCIVSSIQCIQMYRQQFKCIVKGKAVNKNNNLSLKFT